VSDKYWIKYIADNIEATGINYETYLEQRIAALEAQELGFVATIAELEAWQSDAREALQTAIVTGGDQLEKIAELEAEAGAEKILRNSDKKLIARLMAETDQQSKQIASLRKVVDREQAAYDKLNNAFINLNLDCDKLRQQASKHKALCDSIDKSNLVVVNEDDASLWYSGTHAADDWPEGFYCENPVAAEIDRLRREADEADTLIAKQRELLTGVANALRGEPDQLHSHSHHDLPERALKMRQQVARMPHPPADSGEAK
jgi:hypothetical protein